MQKIARSRCMDAFQIVASYESDGGQTSYRMEHSGVRYLLKTGRLILDEPSAAMLLRLFCGG